MAATIKIKNSSTTGAVPTSGDLVQGELAVNVTDTGLYTENASGTVVKLNAPSIDDKNTGATKHLTISTGGSLGLGVTPSANSLAASGYRNLEIGSVNGFGVFAGNYEMYLLGNAYYNSGWKYANSSKLASRYIQTDGIHAWFNAPSGTAGNTITFTQAMTLDASGNLGLGTTSPANFSGYQTITANGTSGGILNTQVNGTNALRIASDSTQGYLFEPRNLPISFSTNATERARIDSSGNLLVGTTSDVTNGGFKLFPTYDASGSSALEVGHITGSSSGNRYAGFKYAGTLIGTITQNGTTAVAYNTTSDYRLKENVQPLTGALARVAALKPCTYTWKAAPDEIGEGFIAHELAEVCPQAVTGEKDAVNEDGSIKPQSIDTSFLVATLTAAIQELNAKFEAYKAAHP